MKRTAALLTSLVLMAAGFAFPAGPKLTIYNQNFAVVRIEAPLDLKAGLNHVEVNDITNYLEPDSVILRDPSGEFPLEIVEQNYRADPVSQERMLQLYEGKTIGFLVTEDGKTSVVEGKIVRSGFNPPVRFYGGRYGAQPQFSPEPRQPIIEVNGQLRFSLPGEPLFPALTHGTVLKPVLSWAIDSEKAGHVDAQLSYITEGLNWDATYNAVEPANGQTLNLLGWVTLHNRSGMTFSDAQVKLMAGTVNKTPHRNAVYVPQIADSVIGGILGSLPGVPLVTQQPFDEYHLYSLHRPVTLRDMETKQVEFVRASGVQSTLYYVYDGLKLRQNYNGWNMQSIRQDRGFGTGSTHAVRVMREFENTAANHLGIPLPAGRLRFYRLDKAGNLEFLGASPIPHTPAGKSVDVYTGNSFDLEGDRTRTNYSIDMMGHTLDESFEINLHNHKTAPVEIRVDEHLYRGRTWNIIQHSNAFVKLNSQAIEFRVEVPANGEKQITYTVHYTW